MHIFAYDKLIKKKELQYRTNDLATMIEVS